MNTNSPVLQAFLDQQTYTDQEAIEIENRIAKIQEKRYQEASSQLMRSQTINDYIAVPSQIQNGDLDQKTEAHPQLKEYDHSLEQTRRSFKFDKIETEVEIGDNEGDPIGTDYNLLDSQFGIDWDAVSDKL